LLYCCIGLNRFAAAAPAVFSPVLSVAYLPPLEFRVMDQSLLQATQCAPARINNFDPAKRERLIEVQGQEESQWRAKH
jgi:hypothetical protein